MKYKYYYNKKCLKYLLIEMDEIEFEKAYWNMADRYIYIIENFRISDFVIAFLLTFLLCFGETSIFPFVVTGITYAILILSLIIRYRIICEKRFMDEISELRD